MKVEIKNIDATKRELNFKIPKERVSQKLNEVYEGIGKEAKIRVQARQSAPSCFRAALRKSSAGGNGQADYSRGLSGSH